MSTITVDRAVLEQALEALEQCGLDDSHRSYEKESVAKAALHAALAQQGQEPVAFYVYEWVNPSDGYVFRSFRPEEHYMDRNPDRVIPVPPRREWQSLTDEEILPLYNTTPSSHAEMLEFARAIEAALKEKNQ